MLWLQHQSRSPNTFSSLPAHCSPSPSIICSGVVMSHPVCTLQPNHISMDHNILHNFSIFAPSAKTNKVFYLISKQPLAPQFYVHTLIKQLCPSS